MTDSPTDRLEDLADQVADEFKEFRQESEFKEISIVVDTSDAERPTLIVHVESDDADSVATQIESFLQDQGARTEREPQPDAEIRVLATLD